MMFVAKCIFIFCVVKSSFKCVSLLAVELLCAIARACVRLCVCEYLQERVFMLASVSLFNMRTFIRF